MRVLHEKIYGVRKEDIISFSANVNPLGVSFRLRDTLTTHIDAITTYPDREYTSLRKCIAGYVGTNDENIVVGNGSRKRRLSSARLIPSMSGKFRSAEDARTISGLPRQANLFWTRLL